MHCTVEDIVHLRTSSDFNRMERIAPPSYEQTLAVEKGPLEDDLLGYFESLAGKPVTGEQPPKLSWLVKSEKQPSAFKLLAGPVMSNANTFQNCNSAHQRRYRVIWPRGYEDVYLHKSSWSSNPLPDYHAELYQNNSRYESEPFILLGPTTYEPSRDNEHAQAIASANFTSVLARIQDEVEKLVRYVRFCEFEYFSWDWKCKTEAAKQDMRVFTDKGKEDSIKLADLVLKLGEFVVWVGRERDEHYKILLKRMRKRVGESSHRLARLHL